MLSRLVLQSSAGIPQITLRVLFCQHLAVWRLYEGE